MDSNKADKLHSGWGKQGRESSLDLTKEADELKGSYGERERRLEALQILHVQDF